MGSDLVVGQDVAVLPSHAFDEGNDGVSSLSERRSAFLVAREGEARVGMDGPADQRR